MIHALEYEPQGQRQRFEPQEQNEQDRHIHLHFHLDLTFRARRERSIHPNAFRLRRIFIALLAATAMPLLILPLALIPPDGPPPTALENMTLLSSAMSVTVGLAVAWCSIGLLLWVWRTSAFGPLGQGLAPAIRSNARESMGLALLLIPIVVGCCLFFIHGFVPSYLLMIVAVPYLLMFITNPLITALLLLWMCREARTLHRHTSTHNKLVFVVVWGMVLMLLGGMLFNIQAMLGGGISPPMYLLPICIAMIVAIRALFGLFRSDDNRQAYPKDASPFDTGSPMEF